MYNHLEGSQSQFKHQPLPLTDILRRKGKHRVVNSKQGNQQQGGASQSPVTTEGKNFNAALQLATCVLIKEESTENILLTDFWEIRTLHN